MKLVAWRELPEIEQKAVSKGKEPAKSRTNQVRR